MEQQTKVLALKYRPKRFEDLVGQGTISQTLSLALDSNRLSHAYLFSGLRGSGKTSTARIMAKALLCESGPTSKPCDVCNHCLSSNTNSHLDIIEMDAASNRGIDDIKDLIEHTKYKPSSARFKVFIIDEVHMLTTQAFNALLKTLEEPPGFVKFILATTDALKLPATILSRTQHFRFKKISNKDVIHHLSHILNEENVDFETECLDIISRSGQGSLRDTLTLLDQAIIFSKGKITTSCVVDMLGLIDPAFMDEVFNIVLQKKDINEIIYKLEEYEASSVCDEMSIYLKEKMLNRDPRFDILLFDRFFRILADAKHLLSLNSDSSFVLLLSLLKMQEATNVRSIDDIINQVQNVEISKSLVQAVNKEIINEHAISDEKHIYENLEKKNLPNNEKSETLINENPKEENNNISLNTLSSQSKENIISDIVSSSVEVIAYGNPFDEISENSNDKIDKEVLKNNIIEQSKSLEDFLDQNEIKDAKRTNKIEDIQNNVTQENITVTSQNPFEENTVNAVSQNPFEENTVNTVSQNPFEENIVNTVTTNTSEQSIIQATNTAPLVQEEQVIDNVNDENKNKFESVINKVYDRDVQLGEAFEENFIFNKFSSNILYISSFAKGESRKLLFKHFALLKSFMYDIYGQNIEIEFVKEETITQKKNEKIVENVASMIENVVLNQEKIVKEELGSGCVADMHKVSQPNPSQQELQINDILKSSMLEKAKELFDVKKITVKTKT